MKKREASTRIPVLDAGLSDITPLSLSDSPAIGRKVPSAGGQELRSTIRNPIPPAMQAI